MSMTVTIESPPGTPVFNNVFSPAALLRFRIYVSTWLGLPEGFCPVHVTMSDVNLQGNAVTSLGGNAIVDIQLPNRTAQPTVTVWHDYVIGVGDDKETFTIGVGKEPGPVPQPPGSSWDQFVKYLPWIVLIGAAGYVYSVLPKKK